MTISLTDPFSVNDGNGDTATYSYVANSPLVGQITFANGAVQRMTTTKQYDYLNRLTQIASQSSAPIPPVSFNYNYNAANQRSTNLLVDGSYWVYQYDSLGQVTSGHKHFRDNTPVPGQEFDYSFDTIGNRTQTQAGGDQKGANQRVAGYSANNLNQITSRQYPGAADVIGAALATNAVTVNGQTAWRKGEYFWSTINLFNSGSAQWQTPTVVSANFNTSGGIYAPSTPEQFNYDMDGNLTADGRWNYTWDAENRLTSMTVNTGAGPQYQLSFVYDAKGRRIQKNVAELNGSGSAYVIQATTNFLYDGWNLIAMLNPQSLVLNSFVWGSDLSGSTQGAGGVGGLLEVGYSGSAQTNCFVAFDGNGNVAALINAADGTVAANYEYGPFGEVIRATGPMAKVNPFTFQTEFYDWETDKIYWKNRYYDSSPGRWLSRDPVNEPGFNLLANANSGKFQQNFDEEEAVDSGNFGDSDDGPTLDTTTEQANDLLYVFVQNNPVNLIDELGLTVYLQAHGVALGFNHSKVTMVVGCGSTWLGKPPFVNPMPNQPGYFYATIGAGPIHHMLVSGLNRSRDIQLQRNKFSTVIPDPAGMSDDDFIGKLIAANAAYPNDLPYALFPTKKGKRYNSNGYASGILLYVTGSMPPRPPHTPGFNKPVPASKF